MGILDSMRARLMGDEAAAAWQSATSGATISTSGAPANTVGQPAAPAQSSIVNPSPQDEVDRLFDAGGPVRGVIVGVRHDMSDDDRPVRTRVRVRVRPRLPGGALGDEAALSAWVGWKVAALLEPGLEIPISLDRSTMTATGIETGQLKDELAPRFGEAKSRRSGWSLETPLQGVTELPSAVRDAFAKGAPTARKIWLDPSDPAFVPIGGVTWEQFVAVSAQTDGRTTNESNDELAQRLGAPAGAWASAAVEWQRRLMANPSLSLQFGEDVQAAQGRSGSA